MSGPRLRCAVYTRKSTEEGLDQGFNSLDAQREASEAYIKSQAGEGWHLLRSRYDDGGLSGGTMDRPALQRLLADIEARKIDAVVVYKVDRLTRSLADFAKIVEVFDGHGVSFVSVTQQFNTTTSMGRLTLNMLLSFAQFEREVTGERIRDKIAASKQKGMWMGGLPPLGYDVQDKKLITNPVEAQTVRELFRLYLELGTVGKLLRETESLGLVTKRRRKSCGQETGGQPFTCGHLYQLLSNPIYVGEIAHKGSTFPGQHHAIVDRQTFEAVQTQLSNNAAARRSPSNAKAPSLLTGLLYDETGDRLSPTHACKKGRRYRYYISKRLMHDSGNDAEGWRLPAKQLEAAVVAAIGGLLRDRCQLFDALRADHLQPASLKRIWHQAKVIATELQAGNDARRREILEGIVRRVNISTTSMAIKLGRSDLARILRIDSTSIEPDVDDCVALTVPIELRRRGVEARLVIAGADGLQGQPEQQLCSLIAQARLWFAEIASGDVTSVRVIAKRDNVHESEVSRTLPLAFLAPDIVTAILDGRQPVEMTVKSLRRISDLPSDWDHQRRLLGFAD